MAPPSVEARTHASAASLFVAFDRAADTPFHQQIYRGIRAAIVDGRLTAGERLPSTRSLATELGVSRLPVLNAYEQLLYEGYLEGRVGAGTYVAASVAMRPRRQSVREHVARPPETPPDTPASADVDDALRLAPFRVGLPALDEFPRASWARLVARHARALPIEMMAYGGPAGHAPLREAIATYLRAARGVRCDPAQVVIVSGSQMALRLCAGVLLTSRDTACVENPGYAGAWSALSSTGATLRGVPVDASGLVTADLDDSGRSRLVYVTPSHQYPLGTAMTASRRIELLQWARRHGAWIVEDDYDSEFRYASHRLSALHGMDDAEQVIYVGTFSKVFFPALRLGYLVVPRPLLDRLLRQRDAMDLFPPTLYQAALTDFITGGLYARHLRHMRIVYRGRRDALLAAIARRRDPALQVVNADAGMHLCAWLSPGIDDVAVAARARALGLCPIALSECYLGGTEARRGLVLGFGGLRESQAGRAVSRLFQAIGDAPGQTPDRRFGRRRRSSGHVD